MNQLIKLRAIIKNLPEGMVKDHKKMYLNNYLEIKKNEKIRANIAYTICLKNTNHFLIRTYLKA